MDVINMFLKLSFGGIQFITMITLGSILRCFMLRAETLQESVTDGDLSASCSLSMCWMYTLLVIKRFWHKWPLFLVHVGVLMDFIVMLMSKLLITHITINQFPLCESCLSSHVFSAFPHFHHFVQHVHLNVVSISLVQNYYGRVRGIVKNLQHKW